MGGIPWWAALIGTPIVAGKMASGVAETVDSLNKVNEAWDARKDRQQFAADASMFAKDPAKRLDPTKYRDPLKAAEWDTKLKSIREAKLKEEAAPVLSAFGPAYRNAVGSGDFTDPESLAVMRTEGVSDVPNPAQMNNPFIREGVAKFGRDLQNEGDVAEIARSMSKGEAPRDTVIARFLTEGGEKSTNQVKTLADLAKQNDEIAKARDRQRWMNSAGNSPEVVKEAPLRAVMASAPYGTTMEELAKLGEVAGVIPKFDHVETGTGRGEERQQVTFDPRTGSVGGTIGQPWMPSAPKITNTLSYQGDKKGLEGIMGNLPKYLDEANVATDSNGRIDKMIGLLDKGAGGPRGYARATAAPMLEMLGIKSQGLTDAQLYQRLASTLAGSLRSQVVGPGPVSNYEQELLKKVSGGGALGEDAARELLTYYKENNNRKIGLYNSTIDSIAGLAPETAKAYRKISAGTGKGKSVKVGKFHVEVE